MSSGILLIVGLGNPGAEYERTRHNAGAWFVHEVARSAHVALRHEAKLQGQHATVKLHNRDCQLLIPTTFMNLCGQSVKALTSYYKIAPENMLVAHDELDLPVGDIRLKFNGGHGGHNGLRDIIRHLNTNQFHRLRIGIGHPGTSSDVSDYVLSVPKKTERDVIDHAITTAQSILPHMLSGEFQKAMHELHTR